MRWARTISMVEVHCEGEVGKVVTGGVIDVPGRTMLEKLDHVNNVDDSIRRFSVYEPRGACALSVNLLLPPCEPGADAGYLILQADRAHAMSGSNTMCVVTALLETGIVTMREPSTVVTLDTPAGMVKATAQCRDGKCERVSVDMVPTFVEALDVPVVVEGLGSVSVDLAFGGIYYALVDARQLGLVIERGAARDLVSAGVAVKKAVDAQVRVRHPERPSLDYISYVMFRHPDADERDVIRTCTVLQPGRVDRSPCGTGSSAHLATMHARGEARVGHRLVTRSTIGSRFEVELRGETQVAGRAAILPRVTGRAWIYGLHQIGWDPSDPFPLGYTLSDTWGEDVWVTQ